MEWNNKTKSKSNQLTKNKALLQNSWFKIMLVNNKNVNKPISAEEEQANTMDQIPHHITQVTPIIQLVILHRIKLNNANRLRGRSSEAVGQPLWSECRNNRLHQTN